MTLLLANQLIIFIVAGGATYIAKGRHFKLIRLVSYVSCLVITTIRGALGFQYI